jgi:precorrin-3B synthase
METGDGYLVRLRLSGGILTPRRAMRLAELSEHFGNGQLELSSRANLQLRGIAERHLDDIRTELDKLGLLDKSEAAEAVRNVIASPLAGLDPAAKLDIRPLVTALEQRLLAEAALQALPGKFGFAIDDGGSLPLGTGITDVVALAMTADWMALFLGGVFAGTGASARLPDIAAQCARAFIELRGDERRMAPLVARVGVEAVRAKAGIEPGTDATGWRPAPAVVGYLDSGLFGLGLPFGAMTAAQLAFIAGRADEIRLSPWRVLFLTGRGVTPNLAADAEAQGLIAKPDDARLAVTACPGSPACASAHTPARRDAERLASLAPALGPGVSLHVSGCAKGCAHAEKTAVTLTGAPDGYKLILAGKADDHPIANGLDLAAAEALLRRLETPR